MKWPWVSRLALELVREERDRLRLLNDKLIEATERLARRQAGMSELPRQPSPVPKKREPIPDRIEEVIGLFASEAVRVNLREQLHIRRAHGDSWEMLEQELLRQTGPVAEPEPVWAREPEQAEGTEEGTEEVGEVVPT